MMFNVQPERFKDTVSVLRRAQVYKARTACVHDLGWRAWECSSQFKNCGRIESYTVNGISASEKTRNQVQNITELTSRQNFTRHDLPLWTSWPHLDLSSPTLECLVPRAEPNLGEHWCLVHHVSTAPAEVLKQSSFRCDRNQSDDIKIVQSQVLKMSVHACRVERFTRDPCTVAISKAILIGDRLVVAMKTLWHQSSTNSRQDIHKCIPIQEPRNMILYRRAIFKFVFACWICILLLFWFFIASL